MQEAEQQPIRGWDFSWLGDRVTSTRLPWSFTALVTECARRAGSMLDMSTGGGEWLAGLPVRPRLVVATEGWPPNVPVARRRLAPLGIEVVHVDDAPENTEQTGDTSEGVLPFDDGSFDLVTNRHGTFAALEVARVLRTGGRFLTEQAGDGVYREFHDLLGTDAPQRRAWRLPLAVRQVEQAGLTVTESREGQETLAFADVGALVWYLRMVPWAVPGFSIEKSRSRLREIHEAVQRSGAIELPLPGFMLEARK